MIATARPCYLPVLREEGPMAVVYRLNRLCIQLGFDQGVPGSAPAWQSFFSNIRCFMDEGKLELVQGFGRVELSVRERVGWYTANHSVYWRHNLDLFLEFVQSETV